MRTPIPTLQDAILKVKRNNDGARFLTLAEAVKGKNAICLIRHSGASKIFIPVVVTIMGTTAGGSVRVAPYYTGQETKIVSLLTLFTRENDPWCSGGPIVSHMHCSGHIEGTVYYKRYRYFKTYDKSLTTEEVERLTLLEWQQHPQSFTRAPHK